MIVEGMEELEEKDEQNQVEVKLQEGEQREENWAKI